MSKPLSASVLASVFERSGGNGLATRLFSDMPDDQRAFISNAVGLTEGEQPVVAHFGSDDHWCLLTDRRLIWEHSGNRKELPTDQIVGATFDVDAAIKRRAVDASELVDIEIVRRDGRTYGIELESGKSFSGMWNALKFLARRNTNAGVGD